MATRGFVDDANGELADYFAAYCELNCADPANWVDEQRLTDTSFDYLQAPLAGGLFLGDYEGLAADGGDFLPTFSLTHDSDPASVYFRRFYP